MKELPYPLNRRLDGPQSLSGRFGGEENLTGMQTQDRLTRGLVSVQTTISRIQQQGKAIPLQAWTGPEGFRMLRLPDFKTIGT